MTTYPDIRFRKLTEGDFDQYMVVEDCCAAARVMPDGTVENIIVPEGFVTNFASVPRLLWWLIPPAGRAANASVVHDFMYWHLTYIEGTTSRRARMAVDAEFLKNLILTPGIPQWQAWAMYQGVRWGGRKYWEKNHTN